MQKSQDQVNTAAVVPCLRFSENQRRLLNILTGGRIPDQAKASSAYLTSPLGQVLLRTMNRMGQATTIQEEIALIEESLVHVTREIRRRQMH